MRYVMLVNIGPVQGFIAAARRTRDLWYGSWLLSELSKCVAARIMQEGGELVFPAVDRTNPDYLAPGSDFSVVNRVVALVDGNPDAVGAKVRADLERLLSEQWEDVLAHEIKGPLYSKEEALAQVIDLVECTWAASPCASDDDYLAARNAVEALMAARKNTRNFKQVTWGDMRPKSSLDGQREAVIPEDRYPADDDEDDVKGHKVDALYRDYHAGRAERLSAVDLLKRLGNKDLADKTPSTSHIAARPFMARLHTEAAYTQPIIAKLIADLEAQKFRPDRPFGPTDGLLGYDGYLLYENRLQSELEGGTRSDESIAKCIAALSDFYARFDVDPAGNSRRLRPSPYYALLLGDGDNMGKVVDAQKTPAAHRAISNDLSTFAGRAKAIVTSHEGHTIYAGGDDVMAFVPLHTLLECAEELHAAFDTAVGRYKSDPDDGQAVPPSLSVGVVIAHHLEPLSDVLVLARKAEKTAKRHAGKNALAVILSKRSGADRLVVGGWSNGIADRLRFLMANVANNVPEGAAYEMLHMQRKLTPTHMKETEHALVASLPQVMAHEAERILNRKRGDRGAGPIEAVTLAKLRGYLKQVGVAELATELILASLLAHAQRLAVGSNGEATKTPRKEKVAA